MVNAVSVRAVMAGLGAFAIVAAGCDGKTSPDDADPITEPLTVTSVVPNVGNTQMQNMVRIAGTGFRRGAVVTFDGIAALINAVDSALITAVAPTHGEGTVDIVVTYQGQTVRLPGAFTYTGMAVTRISPNTGLIGKILGVDGFGFAGGATATMGGIPTPAVVQTSAIMLLLAPPHAPGPADVVITNPNGSSWTLTAGYTYQAVTLTVSATVVDPGGALTVNWDVPSAAISTGDAIGLFRVEASSSKPVWSEFTKGATSGSFTLNAPSLPGEYDFRYIVEDHGNDAVRSSPVTVSPGP